MPGGWNGRLDLPTLTPSILARGTTPLTDAEIAAKQWAKKPYVCHSFLTDGKLQFLSDCTHAFAGQTVELPDRYDDKGNSTDGNPF